MLSIGPSWPFTVGLLIFALFAAGYFVFMLGLLKHIGYKMYTATIILIITNILLLLSGILSNPGIP